MSPRLWLICLVVIASSSSLLESPQQRMQLATFFESPQSTRTSTSETTLTPDTPQSPILTSDQHFERILRRVKDSKLSTHHHAKNFTHSLLSNDRSPKAKRSRSFSYSALSDFYAQNEERKVAQQNRLARKRGAVFSDELAKQRKRDTPSTHNTRAHNSSISKLATALNSLWKDETPNNVSRETMKRLIESRRILNRVLNIPPLDDVDINKHSNTANSPYPILTPNADISINFNSNNSFEKKRRRSRYEYRTERSDNIPKSPQTHHSYALVGQYWWLAAIISAIIMILVAITCILGMSQYKSHMKQKQKGAEATINERYHRSNTNNAYMPSSSQRHRRIEIETTASNQAPCNRWMLCDQIGSGRFGDVRLAIDPQLHTSPSSVGTNDVIAHPKFYAVKRAICVIGGVGTEAASIFQEILILSQLKHPNIVRYYGNGGSNQYINLFLEWCPVGSMADVLSIRKCFSVPRIHHYLSQLLSAADYLHSLQIYHRDIKARNILLCTGGICKLADYGSAVDVHMQNQQVSVAGTVHWWPPELFLSREQHVDTLGAHDVWSLGVTLIEMLHELPLFHELSVNAFRIMMKTTPKQYLERLPVTTDINLNIFIAHCLTIDYKQRRDIKQLLQHPFIVSGPQQQDIIYDSTIGISSFLKNREKEATNYAASIMNSNLERWIASKADSASCHDYITPLPSTANTYHSSVLKTHVFGTDTV